MGEKCPSLGKQVRGTLCCEPKDVVPCRVNLGRAVCTLGDLRTRKAGSCGHMENGVPERIRTSGLRIRNPLLYPAELRGLTPVYRQGGS